MKIVKVVVVGFGDRGGAYTKYAIDHPDRLKVQAVVDPNPFRRQLAKERFSLSEEMLFESVTDCVNRGKIADAVINTTMDELHIETALPFLKLGYDMLLEKPVTNNKKDLLMLKSIADRYGCKLMVCHVLRYTPFYLKIKEIVLSGEIGKIVEIESNEMVGVAHASASYIRGKWNNREKCGSSKTALEDEIKKCKETYFEEAYTKISYGYYLEALTSAEEIFASNIVSQKEIDEVLSELKKAENSLIALGDKTVLNGAIEEVKALKKSDYTAESYAAVEKALKDAERILALDAPTLKQTEIAAENLENATKELVSVSTEQKGSDSESSGCNGALGIPLFGVGAAVGLVLKKRRK